jgi:hypothetical protein
MSEGRLDCPNPSLLSQNIKLRFRGNAQHFFGIFPLHVSEHKAGVRVADKKIIALPR